MTETATPAATITKTLSYGRGYKGKSGEKCWIARIMGREGEGFRRRFVEAAAVEMEHPGRSRTMINLTYELHEGLYQLTEEGVRRCIAVYRQKDGALAVLRVSDERARAWARHLDEGLDDDDARAATRPVEPETSAEVSR